MRAWRVTRYGEPSHALEQVDIAPPPPGPGELRLQVHAAALGMPDAFMCGATYGFSPTLPFTPGQEVCGTVLELGEGVGGFAVGQRIMGVTSFPEGHGGFAEQALARAGSCYRVPDDMSDAEAAGFRIGFSTAWIGLVRRGALALGDDLLVLGAAGGSGITAVQLGAALGARVIAVAAGPEKGEYCKRLGADVVIDRTTVARTHGGVSQAVLDATGGRGADIVYDPVGGDLAADALRCVAPEGRFLVVGYASGRWVQPNIHHVVTRNYSIVGVYAGSYAREQNEQDHEALLALVAQGRLGTAVTRTVPFGELPAALDEVASGRVVGKTVLLAAC
jgi:NADPH2:quinone reductase